MAKTAHYYTRFESDSFYHVYNRGIDGTALFKSSDNYLFFLKQYQNYLGPVVETYSFCLLNNHFHILFKIPSENAVYKAVKIDINKGPKDIHDLISHRFRKFFQSYALAFNKRENRKGGLFQRPFKRALIDSEKYLRQVLIYIHRNAQHHNMTDDFKKWKWSSYPIILSTKPTALKRNAVLALFDGKPNFIEAHKRTFSGGLQIEE